MTITFNTETIRLLTLFENMTNVSVRDCFVNNNVVHYVVEEGKIGLAIGKNGNLIKKAENLLEKRIKVYEYSSDPVKFIKNLIPQSKEVLIREGVRPLAEIRVDKRERGNVIGRGGKRIKVYREILKRVHNIADLRVK